MRVRRKARASRLEKQKVSTKDFTTEGGEEGEGDAGMLGAVRCWIKGVVRLIASRSILNSGSYTGSLTGSYRFVPSHLMFFSFSSVVKYF